MLYRNVGWKVQHGLLFVIWGERKLDLKIISAGNTEYASVQLFSDEDGSPSGRVFIAIIVSRCSSDDVIW